MNYYVQLARSAYGDKLWILAVAVQVGAPARLSELRTVGADRVLVIAGSRGTGEVGDAADAIVLGVEGATLMESIHGLDRALGGSADRRTRRDRPVRS
ncbi:hypothetical protein BH23ACT10_BH23ACT10_27740 [soil metagenome]